MSSSKARLFVLALIPALPLSAAAQQPYDVVIRNGRVLDGTGVPWYYADVAISGDRISAVGDLTNVRARRVIDATGLYVAPGFIDVHTHAGPGLATAELSSAGPLLVQGITTVIVNPDGGGPVDLAAQRQQLLEHGVGVNVALLIGHGSVRQEVLGMEDRAPTPQELEQMRVLVRAAMEEGAYGMSSGLYYSPGSYATTEEVIELSKVVGDYGGLYTSHIRDEADYNIGVVAAVDEVIRIAREAGIPGIVTHIKALGPRVWGFSSALVERIERARAQGVEVWADQYPYEASGTSITGALVPRWALVGGRDSLLARIENPETRQRLRADILENLDRRGGAARLSFRRHEPDPSIEGRTLEEVAEERGLEPVDLAIDLLKAGGARLVSFNMKPAEVELFMRQPWTMTCSDGDLERMGVGKPHPRSYGTFPRKIRVYVLQRGVIDLATAVHSMTGLSATVFRLDDRGYLRPGASADIVVFDLERLRDTATYDDPHQLAEGMVHVLVNGAFAIESGQLTGDLNGRVLSRRAR
ncbi:MAG: D-aminoacylase [Gemmatimonadota bacterium]|nr:MAG: D-aminoacylase [Gemmatimonadota bacterium]